ncbi:hypothetical protein ASD56_10465 [Microbacterium sp. Root166]|nr:hypothetical protein ASD56_10465 [Microbacterium sp. Root166]
MRLPRPPGVFRRFWARHPRWADALLAILCLLLTLAGVVAAAYDPRTPGLLASGAALSLLTCVALLWRRRWPIAVFAITLVPALILAPALSGSVMGPAPVIALYSVAVYRSSRAAMWSLGAAAGALALVTFVWTVVGDASANAVGTVIGTGLFLAIGALIGVNVGNRKRYVAALIDRSRQLAVERDQQARLAAADERTRIAREMHDIVSHSLTVIVALAEGANATPDPDRSREASRAVATTAREALAEMRVMLGVLRDTPSEGDAAPTEPLLDTSLHDVIGAARAAGFPVTLSVSGDTEVSAPHSLAVLRIVQEAITNAMRYSRDATFIRVVTEYSGAGVRIVVDNDGARPDVESAGAGWGLRGLQERAGHLGGTLTAGLVAPGRWRLTAELPTGAADA